MFDTLLKGAAVAGLVATAGCATLPEGFNYGDDSSVWAFDGDCDDPRFDGPGAHTLLLPVDARADATDCRQLFEAGRIFLRTGYQEGVTYENPNYVRQTL